jgi:hypothetical protein
VFRHSSLNHEAVVKFFGHWPLFHDAKVCAYEPVTAESPILTFTLHTWQMTNEVDAKGTFVLRNHALASLVFLHLHNVQMDAFRCDNILFGLKFDNSNSPDSFRVELDSVMDMSGSFSARSGKIISVIPCTADGKVS